MALAMDGGRDRRGGAPLAVFSLGLRPFFLGAALWAALAMALWVGLLSGAVALPVAWDPVAWHAHAILFGYLGAVIGGFLLTAVPNWTGRRPLSGAPLAALVALWLAGRVAVTLSAVLPALAVALIDLSAIVALTLFTGREIVAAGNRRNLVVVALVSVYVAANALFHWQAAAGGAAAQGAGLRLGLAAALLLIALIGGRIVPAFTRNWLVARGETRLPAAFGAVDRAALATLIAALAAWVLWPHAGATGAALIGAGLLHLWRLSRWRGVRTGAEPLVAVLHATFACLPLGALALGAALVWPGAQMAAAAQHLWMAGAVGGMTLAVMARASLGHTGRPLTAGPGVTALFVALGLAVLARLAAGALPGQAGLLHAVSGLAWIAAFGGFAVLFAPLLLRPRAEG